METPNKNSADQMIIGNCVSCEGLVRIPINANPNSIVKCPRCDEEFTLGMVLDQLAPPLEVINTPRKSWFQRKQPKPAPAPIIDETVQQPSDRKPGDKFTVSPILTKGAKRKKRRRRSSSKSGSAGSSRNHSKTTPSPQVEVNSSATTDSDVEISDPNAVHHPATTRPIQRRPLETSRPSSSRSGGLEMTKIIFGAMLAIPVAQMLIWWFAGTDPLGVGPFVGKIAPFVVPVEFRIEDESGLDKIFNNSVTSEAD